MVAPKMCFTFNTGDDFRAFRSKLGLTQFEFWRRVGITQSGGSRYENGRELSVPVQMLMEVVYGSERQSQDYVRHLRRYKDPIA